MELSVRLKTIADMVTAGNRVADVGCDHGFVSIYLFEKGIAPRVYAMDLREGPLQRAREHIAEKGYESYIETLLSDGVEALGEGEAEALVCAGMGGRLIAEILNEGMEKVREMKELILGPQSELAFLREFLRKNDFQIIQEEMVKEEGKYYPIIKAAFGAESCKTGIAMKDGNGQEISEELRQKLEDAYGPLLIRNAHPVLKDFLENRYGLNESILAGLTGEKAAARRVELLEEQEGIRICLHAMA